MRDSKEKHMQYQRAWTRLIREAKQSNVMMQNVCIKVVLEYLDQELHLQSIKNGCTETLLMHLYLYALPAVMNLDRKAA